MSDARAMIREIERLAKDRERLIEALQDLADAAGLPRYPRDYEIRGQERALVAAELLLDELRSRDA